MSALIELRVERIVLMDVDLEDDVGGLGFGRRELFAILCTCTRQGARKTERRRM